MNVDIIISVSVYLTSQYHDFTATDNTVISLVICFQLDTLLSVLLLHHHGHWAHNKMVPKLSLSDKLQSAIILAIFKVLKRFSWIDMLLGLVKQNFKSISIDMVKNANAYLCTEQELACHVLVHYCITFIHYSLSNHFMIMNKDGCEQNLHLSL